MKTSIIFLILMTLVSCSKGGDFGEVSETDTPPLPISGNEDSNTGGSSGPSFSISQVPRAICDPFRDDSDSTTSENLNYGIHGILYDGINITNNMSLNNNFRGYMENGIKKDADIFMNDLYIPTRNFEDGFVIGEDQSGGDILLKNANGENLIEYFGIRFDGRMTLSDSDEEGYYEIATISDDGSLLKVKNEDGELETIIDNDNYSSSKMTCTSKVIRFTKETKLQYELDYFQAPKTQIALVAIWRKVADLDANQKLIADKTTGDDSLCGLDGNQTFFNNQKDVESTPTANFTELLNSRSVNWKVMKKENFLLPSQEDQNPCNDPNYNPLRHGCFIEKISGLTISQIQLNSHDSGIDSETFEIKLNGNPVDETAYSYDQEKNEVSFSSLSSSDQVEVGYCLKK